MAINTTPVRFDGQNLKYLQVASSEDNVANGTTNLVAAQSCARFDSIVGVCKSDVALTLNVYQGSSLDNTDMEYVTPVSVPAASSEGAGAAFSVAVVNQNFRIDVVNGGSTSTSFKFAAGLRAR